MLALQGQIWSDALQTESMPPGTGQCPGDTSSLLESLIAECTAADPVQCPAGEQLQRAGISHGGHGELYKERHRDDQQAVTAVQQVGTQPFWQSHKHLVLLLLLGFAEQSYCPAERGKQLSPLSLSRLSQEQQPWRLESSLNECDRLHLTECKCLNVKSVGQARCLQSNVNLTLLRL